MNTVVDINTYVGIPYKPRGRDRSGIDCWGLCLLVGREMFDLEFPKYYYSEDQILDDAKVLIKGHRVEARWVPVDGKPRPGDIHIFRILGFETHCGIHLKENFFLHSLPGRNSCLETLDDSNWVNRKTGSYRWAMS